MKAKEFDERFDAGEDMAAALDTPRARRPGEEHRRVNVDFPARTRNSTVRQPASASRTSRSSRSGSPRSSTTAIILPPDDPTEFESI